MKTSIAATGISAAPGPRWYLLWVCGCLALGAGQLQAQTVYRSVGPNGQITFSDMPGMSSSTSKVNPFDNKTPSVAPVGVALPFELRQVVGKFPVMLYTSGNCAPCDSGRNLLVSRGVPFTEKTISSAQDSDALQKLSGGNSVPLMTIGAQQVSGFSAAEWTQYLTAAGYPERSRLPASYRAAPATPLTAPAAQASAPSPAASAEAAAVPVAPPVGNFQISPANPAGIQF